MWLEDSLTIKSKKDDSVTICVGDSMVKVDTPGKVLCKYCNGVINYGSKGRVAIIDHVKFGKHASEVDHRQCRNLITFLEPSCPREMLLLLFFPCLSHLHHHPNTSILLDLDPPLALKLIPLVDRTANMESMILSFMAENSLSFTLAPNLLNS